MIDRPLMSRFLDAGITLHDIAFDRGELATLPDKATQWRAASVVWKIAQCGLSEKNAP